jgi:hypothetical protein
MKHFLLCLLLLAAPFVSTGQTSDPQLEKALAFLKSAQDSTGQFSDSLNPLFNVWETILVTDALLETLPYNDPVIVEALDWLKANENADGLICHNTSCRDRYCVETSAMYIRLLTRVPNVDPYDPRPAANRIAAMQEPNGSWKIGNPDVRDRVDFASVTAFALNLLHQVNNENGYDRMAALQFLAAHQQADGSLGKTWEYYNCYGYALWQCFYILDGYPETFDVADKARTFMLGSQLPDGSWNDPDQPVNHISPELQTLFMLHALYEAGETSTETFRKGLDYIRTRQLPNGAWDGGLFPIPKEQYKKREYLVATALAYKLLARHPKNDALHD